MRLLKSMLVWKRFLLPKAVGMSVIALLPWFSFAETTFSTSDVVKAVNTVWVLVAAAMVFFMQLGFAYLEAGFVRSKNASSIIMEGFIDTCITAVIFWMFGYGLMFGEGNAFFGTSYFFMNGIPTETLGIPTLAFMFFQFAFASAASTIISGGLGERVTFEANLLYSVIVILFVYPIVGHWVWGPQGWLAGMGFLDFAGSTVVHSVGGWATLGGLLVLGPRLGKYTAHGTTENVSSHNVPFIALGTFVLWFGWFGFNGGSTLSAMDTGLISKIFVNSNLAASSAAIVTMFISWAYTKKPDIVASLNGALVGLVAITAGCAYVSTESALLIGAIGAPLMYFGGLFLESKKIDDAVGAVAVHGFGGTWGTLAVGLFHQSLGLLTTGTWGQLGVQALGVLTVATSVIGGMYLVFTIMGKVIPIRVSERGETEGLDKYRHGIISYPEQMQLL